MRTRAARALAASAAAAAAVIATTAAADPCTAIPERGRAPSWMRVGATFSGPVPHVIDGDSLCVDTAPENPDHPRSAWVEVRLEDLDAPELHTPEGPAARDRLANAVRGRIVSCTMAEARRPYRGDAWRSYDRAVASCTIDGISLADRLSDAPLPTARRFGTYAGRTLYYGLALVTLASIAGAFILSRRQPRRQKRRRY